jgi:hypothetical protein
VNEWTNVFLAVIAAATLIMALIQVGAIVMMAKVARQAQDTLASIHQDVKTLIVKASAIADEASKTATLATQQVQKIDRLVSDLTVRVDETAAIVQQAIVVPAREGMAVIAALKAGLSALKGATYFRRRHPRHEEEDPLFIG